MKSDKRSNTLKMTREKRKSQICKVYELKINKRKLSKKSLEHLKFLFLESKWLYNSILSSGDIKTYDTKIKEVNIKVKGCQEFRKLSHISAQMKQTLRDRTFQNIINLSKAKKKGLKVGKLKFKSYVNCIPLNQHLYTHKIIKSSNSVKLQGLKNPIKVHGLQQIPKDAEFANANLIEKGGDYYFKITTFIKKVKKNILNKSIGIDFGCSTQLTLTNGIKLTYGFPVPKGIRKLDRKIMKKNRKRSNNKFKDLLKRRKLYTKLNNKKKDVKNKIVSTITNNYKYVVFQDEDIKTWQSNGHGKKIRNTGIGGIISELKKNSHTPIMVDKFFPSTQLCPACNFRNKPKLEDRIYVCSNCGYTEDRDLKSSQCIEFEGLKTLTSAERRRIMPGDTETNALKIFSTLENIVNVSFCRKTQFSSNIKLGKSQEALCFNKGSSLAAAGLFFRGFL